MKSLYQRYEPEDKLGALTFIVAGYQWWKLIAVGFTVTAGAAAVFPGIQINESGGNTLAVVGSKYKVTAGNDAFVSLALNLPVNEQVDLSAGIAVLPVNLVNDACVQLPLPDIEWNRDGQIVIAVAADVNLAGIYMILQGQRN